MNNLLSIKYFKELNQHSLVDEKIINNRFPDLENMAEEFLNCVEEVYNPKSENPVHIGISFTNTAASLIYVHGRNRVKENYSFMFWPVYDEVEYKFKKGPFFLNEDSDPKVLLIPKGWFEARDFFTKLFFNKNPYENLQHYKRIEVFLPDASGNRSLCGFF